MIRAQLRRTLFALLVLLAAPAATSSAHAQDPAILTVTGAIESTNRPPFDAFRDSLFGALDEPFEKAYAFSRADLLALPQVEITVSYPNWPAPVAVRGPLLKDVLTKAGATGDTVLAQAVDGYSPSLKLSELDDAAVVLALEADGTPLSVGGRGPVWLVYPSDAKGGAAEDDSGLTWALFHLKVTSGG
jgi:hypothetical protein